MRKKVLKRYQLGPLQTWRQHNGVVIEQECTTSSRFTCPEKAVLFNRSFRAVFFFFFADSRRKKGFRPVENLYFCVGQQKKKELLEKNL